MVSHAGLRKPGKGSSLSHAFAGAVIGSLRQSRKKTDRLSVMKAKLIVTLIFVCLSVLNVEAQTRRARTPRSAPPSAAITTPSGLTYLITKKGTGPQLKAGDTVVLNY